MEPLENNQIYGDTIMFKSLIPQVKPLRVYRYPLLAGEKCPI